MSYILDALRKSEEERRRGNLPDPRDFSRVADSTPGRKRWAWPLAVAGLLMVNLLGGVLWWAPWQHATQGSQSIQEDTMPEQEATKVSVIATSTPKPAQTIQGQATANQLLATQPPVTTTPIPTRHALVATPAIAPTIVPESPVPQRQSAHAVSPVPRSTPPEQPQPQPREPLATYPVATPGYTTQTTAQPDIQATSSAVVRPRQHRYLPQLTDLPVTLQRQIPELVFSSHMYANVPRYRSIIINGRRLKEGQFLAGDLIVHEITETGVIMKFNETLFVVDVLSQW